METYSSNSEDVEIPAAVSASVERWTKLIRITREKRSKDYLRMKGNMEFATGLQWREQTSLDDDRYVSNGTLRQVNQKVAALYAKNPTFATERRKRLEFQIWDGRIESLQQAVTLSMSPESLPEDTLAASALIADYTTGRASKDLIDKVGLTLQYLLTFYVGDQTPSFKKQMKQMVRRAVIMGVAFVKLDFAVEEQGVLSTTEKEASTADRIRMADEIMRQLNDGEIEQDSPELVRLQALLSSLQSFQSSGGGLNERLVFDFPCATSIIIDMACRNINGFIGANWIAQEYIMPIEEINAHFQTKISYGTDIKPYNEQGEEYIQDSSDEKPKCCLWEVYDRSTCSKFYLIDGYKGYVVSPEAVHPETKNFWPIFALTFNDVEVEPGKTRASIYPPSDVQIMKSPQKEWNRTRQGLRSHRTTNGPKYLAMKGRLTDEDKEKLANAPDNSVIEIQGAAAGEDITKLVQPMIHQPIDPIMYDTSPLLQDMFLTNGNEEGSQPASSKGTATAATINEQSRMVVTASNIDDLDDLLCDVAEAAGEILLRNASVETVKRIVGPGAVWPGEGTNREDYVNWVFLQVVAASSGRPNKALEISNFQQLAPILMQAGASPQFIVREAIKRLDDRLDIDDAFALGPQAQVAMPMTPPQDNTPPPDPAHGKTGPSSGNQLPAATSPKVQSPKV